MRQLQLEQAKQVTKLRQEVEQGARDLASKADRRMKVRSCGSRTILRRLLPEGAANLLPSGGSTPGQCPLPNGRVRLCSAACRAMVMELFTHRLKAGPVCCPVVARSARCLTR